MKNLLFLITFVCAAFYSKAQTTAEEYAFLKTGYKTQVVEQGGDLKKGYELIDITKATTTVNETKDVRKGWLKGFYKLEENNIKRLVGYLVVYQLNNNALEYICIPHPSSSSEILSLYLQTLYDGDDKINSGFRLQLIGLLLSKGLKW